MGGEVLHAERVVLPTDQRQEVVHPAPHVGLAHADLDLLVEHRQQRQRVGGAAVHPDERDGATPADDVDGGVERSQAIEPGRLDQLRLHGVGEQPGHPLRRLGEGAPWPPPTASITERPRGPGPLAEGVRQVLGVLAEVHDLAVPGRRHQADAARAPGSRRMSRSPVPRDGRRGRRVWPTARPGRTAQQRHAELLRSLHDLGVLRAGQDRQAAVREEVEHLGGVVEADEVLIPDHKERGGGHRADLVVGPARPIVDDRLYPLEEREEVVGVGRHGLIGASPGRELLLGGEAGIVLLRCRDLRVVAIGPDVDGGEHETPDLRGVPHGDARRRQGPEAEAPEVGRSAAGHPVHELGDVVGEALDRHGPAGVGRVAVALKLDPDHPAALREPRQHVAEAAVEGKDPTVEGDERRPVGVAVLLVPDGNAVDLLVRHGPHDVRVPVSAPRRPSRGKGGGRPPDQRAPDRRTQQRPFRTALPWSGSKVAVIMRRRGEGAAQSPPPRFVPKATVPFGAPPGLRAVAAGPSQASSGRGYGRRHEP